MMYRTILALSVLASACGGPAPNTTAQPPARDAVGLAPPAPTEPEPDPAVLAHLDHLSLRLANDDPQVRIRAAADLAAYGPEARPVLAFLIACMVTDDPAPAEACAVAVVAIGEAAVPHLERVIASRPASRALAEQTLAAIQRDDPPVTIGRP
jgi:hypothetical protein